MKLAHLIPKLGTGFSTFCLISAAQAGIPAWSFAPHASFPPAQSVNPTGTVLVKYTVSNNSSKAHDLVIKPQRGVSQTSPCLLGPKGSAHSTCQLSLTISGSALPASGLTGGPVFCQANLDKTPNPNECYQPSKADSLAITVTQGAPILNASTANLALSVNETSTNAALTGNPRQITITNNGDAPATGLSISYPTWPTGTTVNTSAASACTNGGTLAVGGSCTITISPGAIATSGAGNAACTTGIAPTPGVVTVTANGSQTSTNVVVLSYGCVYQGGFLYSVDDSYVDYPESGSIGGKVVSLVDQAEPYINSGPQPTSIIWSSNGSGATSSDGNYTTILGIDETSTTLVPSPTSPAYPSGTSPYTACNGSSDGSCDASNIISYYNANRASGGSAPTPLTYYAAGLCTATINSYTDWYLPAICEMDAVDNDITCPSGMQSMVGSLSFLIGDSTTTTPSTSCTPPSGTNCLAGSYWSSTEASSGPQIFAWNEYFSTASSFQSYIYKNQPLGVRCSRALSL